MNKNVSFIRGLKENYNPSEMQGGLFFSKDSKEILLNGESYGNSVKADEEDITQEEGNLKLKDRAYDEANFSGKGYVILRKNIQEITVPKFDLTISSGCTTNGTITVTLGDFPTQVEVTTNASTPEAVAQLIQAAIPESTIEGAIVTFTSNPTLDYSTTGVAGSVADNSYQENRNILTQEMINTQNTIYEVRYDFDLNNQSINIPNNSILRFNGGKLKNGTILGNNTIISTRHQCLESNIILSGSFNNNSISFDWFINTKITEDDYNLNTPLNIQTKNDAIIENILSNKYVKEIVFGNGIYLFNKDILINRSFSGLIFRGSGKKSTCLYFPNSKGLYFYTGNLTASIFKDFTIHSKLECFYISYRTNVDRFNAFYDNILSDIEMISNEGEFCFGANRSFASFIYHNQFANIGFYGENGFARVSGLGTSYKGMYDCYTSFTNGKLVAITKDRSVFFNCSDMFIYDSNFTYNRLSHICKFISSETEADLSIQLIANNCNFEGFTNSFVYTTGKNALMYINFVNCSFTTRRDIIDDSFYHFNISRCSMFRGVPSSIFNDIDRKNYPLNIKIIPEGNLDYDIEMSYQSDVKYTLIGNNNIKGELKVGKNYSRIPLRDNIAYTTEYSKNSVSIKTDVDLTVKDTIKSDYNAYPKLVRIINSSPDKNVLNILGKGTNNFAFGECTSNGNSVTILNQSKYVIIINDGITQKKVLPNSQIIFHHYGLYTDYSNFEIKDNLYIAKEGRLYNGKECIKENCGIWCSDNYNRKFTEFNYSSVPNPFSIDSIMKYNNHLYICIKSGMCASTPPGEYATKVNENDIVIDGTAEFCCIGKAAILANTIGSTEQRPNNVQVGFQYFDTTISKPIWWTGSTWIDANSNGSDQEQTNWAIIK